MAHAGPPARRLWVAPTAAFHWYPLLGLLLSRFHSLTIAGMVNNSDLTDPAIHQETSCLVKSVADEVMNQQNSIIGWLFIVNGGAIGGMLTFIAAKGTSRLTTTGLVLFFFGLALILTYRAVMYYWLSGRLKHLLSQVGEMASGAIGYNSFLASVRELPNRNMLAEVLAWLSGVAAVAGGIFSAFGISRIAQS